MEDDTEGGGRKALGTMDLPSNLFSHNLLHAPSFQFRAQKNYPTPQVIAPANCLRIAKWLRVMLHSNCFRVMLWGNCYTPSYSAQ